LSRIISISPSIFQGNALARKRLRKRVAAATLTEEVELSILN